MKPRNKTAYAFFFLSNFNLFAMQLEDVHPIPETSASVALTTAAPNTVQATIDEIDNLIEQIESNDLQIATKACETLGNAFFSGKLVLERNTECARAILALGTHKQKNLLEGTKVKKKKKSSPQKGRSKEVSFLNKSKRQPNYPLIIAAAHLGSLPLVMWLVKERNVAVDTKNPLGETALFAALKAEQYHVAFWLLEQKADPTIAQMDNLLSNCITKAHFHVIIKLRAHGLNLFNMKCEYPFLGTFFSITLEAHRAAALELIFESPLTPSELSTLFCVGVLYCSKSVINYCLEKGIDVKSAHLNGISPLVLALRSFKLKGIRQFDLSEIEEHSVRERTIIEVLELLLSQGLDINSADKNSSSPLHEAVELDNVDLVNFLLDKGADPSAGGSYTPPVIACANARNKVLKLFLKRAPETCRYLLINEEKHITCYPFTYVAAAADNREGVALLRAHGADINEPVIPEIELKDGEKLCCMPPLYFAALNSEALISSLLIAMGANSQISPALAFRITNKEKVNVSEKVIDTMQRFIDLIKG